MLSVENKEMLNGLQNHEDGEVCLVKDEHMVYKYSSEKEEWVSCGSTQIQRSLYDLNKEAISQMKKMDKKDLLKSLYQAERTYAKCQYFMLLCREKNYYTLFHNNKNNEEKFIDVIQECLQDLGKIVQITMPEDDVYEFWLKDEEECFAVYGFNYDKGVIECQ